MLSFLQSEPLAQIERELLIFKHNKHKYLDCFFPTEAVEAFLHNTAEFEPDVARRVSELLHYAAVSYSTASKSWSSQAILDWYQDALDELRALYIRFKPQMRKLGLGVLLWCRNLTRWDELKDYHLTCLVKRIESQELKRMEPLIPASDREWIDRWFEGEIEYLSIKQQEERILSNIESDYRFFNEWQRDYRGIKQLYRMTRKECLTLLEDFKRQNPTKKIIWYFEKHWIPKYKPESTE